MGCTQKTQTEEEKENKESKRLSKNKNVDIRKNYEFISMLGNGNFGKVRLYRDRKQKDLLFAIKTLKKQHLTKTYFELIKNEVNILSNLDHPNIVKYFGVYEDDLYIHILMEYLKGYDLYKIIALKKYTDFDEKDVCEIIFQLLQALSFIHNQNIIHRDIKPENILFANKKDYSTLKLIDFGLSAYMDNCKNVVGTPYYMAPEMIDGHSYPQSDIWSIGVIIYLSLTGKFPFESKDNRELFDVIKKKEINIEPLNESECSDEAKDFIMKCLVKDYTKRMTASDCLNHAWITKFCIKKNSNLINSDTVDTLLDFANKNALQKEIYYFLAKISSEKDLERLKNFFLQLDVDNSGTLTVDEIEKAFKEINIGITDEELKQIWEGLDFHKDGQINYSEFLAAMVSSFNFEKEEKLWSVFNIIRENSGNKNYITYESLYNATKALNLNINESEVKKCFEKYNEEIDFETFKKLIMNSEEENKRMSLRKKSSSKIKV
jgi:calcium-dependent protein kinase